MENKSNLSDEELLELLTLTVEIDEAGTSSWRNKDGQLHRVYGPAVIWLDGTQQYYRNGELHRIGGPAIIWADGSVEYWVKGSLHRTDGPAIIYPDGSAEYFLYDKRVEPF